MNQQKRKKLKEYSEVGVIDSSVVAGEVEAILGDIVANKFLFQKWKTIFSTQKNIFCCVPLIILRPIHIFGMGDGKFPIWMNIERQIKANKPVNVEAADCIYIKEVVAIVEKIVENWIPGTYNISSGFVRDGEVMQKIYPKPFEYVNKQGPTGKPRGSLDCHKLRDMFKLTPMYNSYQEMIEDYYAEYESYCQG